MSIAPRTQIIDAALEQVREAGLDSLSVRSVAARAHYSPAGLYRYFESIEELHLELARHVVNEFNQHLWDRLKDSPQPISRHAARAAAEWADNNEEVSALILQSPVNEFLLEPSDSNVPWLAFIKPDATPEEKMRIAILGWDFLRSLMSLRSSSRDFDYEGMFEASGQFLKSAHDQGML